MKEHTLPQRTKSLSLKLTKVIKAECMHDDGALVAGAALMNLLADLSVRQCGLDPSERPAAAKAIGDALAAFAESRMGGRR